MISEDLLCLFTPSLIQKRISLGLCVIEQAKCDCSALDRQDKCYRWHFLGNMLFMKRVENES